MPKGKTTREKTWQRIEYWIEKYPEKTLEECQEMLNKKLLHRKLSNPTNIQYWIKHYPEKTLEECQALHREYKNSRNYSNIAYYKRLHPDWTEEMCQIALKQRIQEAINKRPNNSGTNNPSHKSKTTELQRKQRSVMCIEYYEKHYPELTHEQQLQKMEEKIKYVKYRHSLVPSWNSTGYWIDRGYSEEEARNIIKTKSVSNGLDHYIKKYGEEEGRVRYEQRINQWQKSLHKNFATYGDSRSCQSGFALDIIKQLCNYLRIEIPKKEKFMTCHGHKFAYDFTYNHKIIEFNGDYWHCNPKLYSKDFFNKSMNMSAEDIWNKDRLKKECAEKNGYDYLVVWELEYNQDSESIIKKCKEFLDDRLRN